MDRYRIDTYRNFPPSPSFLPLSLALCTVVLACHYTDVHFPGLDFPRNRSLSTLFSVTFAPAEIIRLFAPFISLYPIVLSTALPFSSCMAYISILMYVVSCLFFLSILYFLR
jgi:hypothetical protein